MSQVLIGAQISAFLAGAAPAFDGMEELSAAERRAWRKARQIAQEKGRGEAMLYLFRHGTIDRNTAILTTAGKIGKAVAAAASSSLPARQNSTKRAYPFAEKAEQYRQFSGDELRYALQDAAKARDAMAGHDLVAEAWYADDVHTIAAELHRRQARRNSRARARRGNYS